MRNNWDLVQILGALLSLEILQDLVFTQHPLHMKFSTKDFFSKCDQIRRKLRIWSNLLKKSLIENLFFCAVILSPSGLILAVTSKVPLFDLKKVTLPFSNKQWKRSQSIAADKQEMIVSSDFCQIPRFINFE